jgi:protein-tyrosine sulfotransferase
VHCGPELKLVPALLRQVDAWRRTMGPDLTAAGVDDAVLGSASRAFVRALLQGTAPVGKRVAEKTPHNLLHTAELARLFPRARFIHVVRDGRAVTASLLRQRWMDPNTGEPLAWCRDVAHASAYWAEVVEVVRNQATAAPERFLEVRYEELVCRPEATMRRVLAFLGERWDDQVLAHELAAPALSPLESSSAAVSQAIDPSAVDKWRTQLTAADLAQLDPRAQAWLVRLGYSSEAAGLRV